MGHAPSGVCPFGVNEGVAVYLDESLRMACICYCPKEAIEYGKKSRGKPRYHFEALEKKQDV